MAFQPPGQAAGTPAVLFQLPVLDPALETSVATLNETNASIEMVIAGVQAFIATKPEEKNFDSLGHTLNAYKTLQPLISSWFGGFLNYDGVSDQVKLTYFQKEKKIIKDVTEAFSKLVPNLVSLKSTEELFKTADGLGDSALEDLKWFDEKIGQLESRIRLGGPFIPAVSQPLPGLSTSFERLTLQPAQEIVAQVWGKFLGTYGAFLDKVKSGRLEFDYSLSNKLRATARLPLGRDNSSLNFLLEGLTDPDDILELTQLQEIEPRFFQSLVKGDTLPTHTGNNIASSNVTIAEAVDRVRNGSSLVVVAGPTGCGKTRAAFEYLAKNYGFFFSVTAEAAVSTPEFYPTREFASLTGSITRGYREMGADGSAKMIHHHMYCMILSRTLILQYCLSTGEKLDCGLFSPFKWLHLQISYPTLCKRFGYSTWVDPFTSLYHSLLRCPHDLVKKCLGSACRHVFAVMPSGSMPVVIDKVQILTRMLPRSFPSLRDDGDLKRPLFSPILRAIFAISVSLGRLVTIATGTGFSAVESYEALMSNADKPEAFPVFLMPNVSWKTAEDVARYADRFLELNNDTCSLLLRYFTGRCRPLVQCLGKVITSTSDPRACILEHFQRIALFESSGSFVEAANQLIPQLDRLTGLEVHVNQAELIGDLLEYLLCGKDLKPTAATKYLVEVGLGRFAFANTLGGFAAPTDVTLDEPSVVMAIRRSKLWHAMKAGAYQGSKHAANMSAFGFRAEVLIALEMYMHFSELSREHDTRAQEMRKWKHSRLSELTSIKLFAKQFDETGLYKRMFSQKYVLQELEVPSVPIVGQSSDRYDILDFVMGTEAMSGPIFMNFPKEEGPDVMFFLRPWKPAETSREPVETLREPAETSREPVKTLREPVETSHEPLLVLTQSKMGGVAYNQAWESISREQLVKCLKKCLDKKDKAKKTQAGWALEKQKIEDEIETWKTRPLVRLLVMGNKYTQKPKKVAEALKKEDELLGVVDIETMKNNLMEALGEAVELHKPPQPHEGSGD